MRIIQLVEVACLAGTLCRGQDFCSIPKLRATTEAAAALDRIVAVVGFDPGTILLYASSDARVKQKGGAMSLACNVSSGTERWIVYDSQSIKRDVARDFVFAHETAHHINFQPLLPGVWSKDQELQADYYGAEYLTRLHWTGEQLLEALNELKLPQGSQQGYPTQEERQASVRKGYADEVARRTTPATLSVKKNPALKPLGGTPETGQSSRNNAWTPLLWYAPHPFEQVFGFQSGSSVQLIRRRSLQNDEAIYGANLSSPCLSPDWTPTPVWSNPHLPPGATFEVVYGLSCAQNIYMVRFWNLHNVPEMVSILDGVTLVNLSSGDSSRWKPKPAAVDDSRQPFFNVAWEVQSGKKSYRVRLCNLPNEKMVTILH